LICCESHFDDLTSTSLQETKFFKVTLHLKFCKVTLPCPMWSTLGCKCIRTLKHPRGQKTFIPQVWKRALHLWNFSLLDQVKEW